MRLKIALFVPACLISILLMGCTKRADFPVLTGPYLGQKPPGMIPEIFAPGIVSTGYSERCPSFTPDGKELYYCLQGAPYSVILDMREVNGRWTKPRVASFSGCYPGELTISPDGNTIVFSSNQPFENSPDQASYWAWRVEREGMEWGRPKPMGPIINSGKFAAYPTLSRNGNIYFYSEREGGMGKDDIYMSEWEDGRYKESRNLGNSINSNLKEVDPFIAPDESYIIFVRRDDDGFEGWDLFISFRKEDGSWTKAKNMGEPINSIASEICPSVSPDGKYFFFTSRRTIHKNYSETQLTYEEKMKILNSPGNGEEDIYWVDAEVIEDLKPDHLK
jgi:Tol biopolymer transport system component